MVCSHRTVASGSQLTNISVLRWHQRIALTSTYCVGISVLRWHQHIALAPAYCVGISILRWHQHIALASAYCIGISILRWHQRIALASAYCVGISILRWHQRIVLAPAPWMADHLTLRTPVFIASLRCVGIRSLACWHVGNQSARFAWELLWAPGTLAGPLVG